MVLDIVPYQPHHWQHHAAIWIHIIRVEGRSRGCAAKRNLSQRMAGGSNLPDWIGVIFGIPKTNYSASLIAMKTERTPVSEKSFVTDISTNEHRIQSTSDPSVQLHLRERRAFNTSSDHPVPLLLIHGATISGVLWDNPLPGCSWMDRLAMDGFHAFAVDLRGCGRSSRPESFNHPPHENASYAHAMLNRMLSTQSNSSKTILDHHKLTCWEVRGDQLFVEN